MSQLPPHAIDEFQVLWKRHYGQELPREQAIVRAHQIFTLVRLLGQPPSHHMSDVPINNALTNNAPTSPGATVSPSP